MLQELEEFWAYDMETIVHGSLKWLEFFAGIGGVLGL
jgi:hypothetical protein